MDVQKSKDERARRLELAKDFDFGRAKELLDFIVEAQKHGPMYQELAALAQAELAEMTKDITEKTRPKTVMPADGGEERLADEDGDPLPKTRPEPDPDAEMERKIAAEEEANRLAASRQANAADAVRRV